MQANPLIAAFNSGEISPRLYGRVDLDFYRNACKRLENVACLPGGAAEKRPGTRFVKAAKTEDKAVRPIPFQFKTEQAYIIEAGDLYFRYYKNKGRLEDPPGTPVETVSPYAAADLAGLNWTQSFDLLYLVHPDYAPRKLSRFSETSWSIDPIDFVDGPYFDENADDTLTVTLTGGPPWTEGSALTMTASAALFDAGHVGALWRLMSGADFAWLKITGFTSDTIVTVETQVDVPASLQGAATAAWREGLWSDYRGWPSCVTFHENRLCFAGAGGQPWRADASASNLYETFTPGTADGDAIAVVLATGQANGIHWLVSKEYLFAGTSDGVQRIGPGGDSAWTPSNTPRKKIEASAAGDAAPALATTALLFVGRHGKRLRAMNYDLISDSQVARDATLRADHIAGPGMDQMAWQETPWQILWIRRTDGVVLGFTFMPSQKVEGWHRHTIGGTDAEVEGIAVIPGANGDELWMVVKRTIDGATHRYMEVLEDWRTDETAQEDHFYVDSGIDYSGAPATVFSGFDHLEGETIRIWADGGPVADKVVQGGGFTLTVAASRLIAGLKYDPAIVPVPIEAGGARGTAAGRLKRIPRLALRLWRSAGVLFGPDESRLDVLQLNEGQQLGSPPDLWSGVKSVNAPNNWGREADLLITGDQAGPLTLNAIMPEMETNE